MKKLCIILPLTLILSFIVGCQDKAAMAELEEQNKALIRNFFEEENNRNIDILNEMSAPNATWFHPSVSTTPIAFEEAFEGLKIFWHAFPDLTLTIEDIIAEGDKVVVRFIGRGTHQGELEGIPATGNKFEVSAIQIFRIEDAKIVETWEISDRLGLMMQLGMELKPKEGE